MVCIRPRNEEKQGKQMFWSKKATFVPLLGLLFLATFLRAWYFVQSKQFRGALLPGVEGEENMDHHLASSPHNEPSRDELMSGAERNENVDADKSAQILLGAPNTMDTIPSYFFFAKDELELGEIDTSSSSKDYGDIEYNSIQILESGIFQSRSIDKDDDQHAHDQRSNFLESIEQQILLSPSQLEKGESFDDLDFPRTCVRPQWTYDKKPNCLAVHDLSYDRTPSTHHQFYDVKFLAHGSFREGHMFTPVIDGSIMPPAFVTKSLRYQRNLTVVDMYRTAVEAVIMENLSASPLTSNIYGYCGTAILVERARPVKDYVLLEKDPYNWTTVERKLDIAIAMAESLAELHGFLGGVIVVVDVILDQWLLAHDGDRVILNDMNMAEFVAWDNEKNNYCERWHEMNSKCKPPHYVNESVDVWQFGDVLYSLITGLLSDCWFDSEKQIQERTTKNGTSLSQIDPWYTKSSFIEGRMADIMDRCHEPDAFKRVDIFEVVRYLRETRDFYQRNQTA